MQQRFSKWEGTGNDFILIDDRAGKFPGNDIELIKRSCDRHFGVGSDGLILIQAPRSEGSDMHMEFHNPDGSRSFCGNGSRCAVAFWSSLTGAKRARFTAIDGPHDGEWSEGSVVITLPNMPDVSIGTDGVNVDFIHTGSPHELVWVEDVEAVDIRADAPARRFAERHGAGGSNINYLMVNGRFLYMRTYERGVEAETLSCGSGVVAAALSAIQRGFLRSPVDVHTRGGILRVEAERGSGGGSVGVQLAGPVREVFHGVFPI